VENSCSLSSEQIQFELYLLLVSLSFRLWDLGYLEACNLYTNPFIQGYVEKLVCFEIVGHLEFFELKSILVSSFFPS
jgi:hypothetical protein